MHISVVTLADLKNIGLVLVYNRQDNIRMTILSIAVGMIMSVLLLAIGE